MTDSNEKKKLVLILPVHDKFRRAKRKSFLPPTTLSVLSSLTPGHWGVSIIDENIASYNERKEWKKIERADLVGISIMTPEAHRGYKIADELRKNGKKVVLGGYHVTACYAEAVKHADAIVAGRAENIWEKLIDDFEKGTLCKEYGLKEEDGKKKIELINPNKRMQPWLIQKNILPWWVRGYKIKHMTYASVGCSNRCPFCYNSLSCIPFTPRKVDEVVEELSQFRGKQIALCDDDIVSREEHAKKLFEAIKGLNLKWLGFASVKIGLPEYEDLLNLAAESGCKWLFIGFETFSENELGKLRPLSKDLSKYLEIVKRVHDVGIKIDASFMVGMEHETISHIYKIIDFADKGSLEQVEIFILTPFPGTQLYKENCTKIISGEWTLFDAQHIVWHLSEQDRNELINKFNLLRKNIYSWKSILKRSFSNRRWNFFERWKLFICNKHKRKKFARIAKNL